MHGQENIKILQDIIKNKLRDTRLLSVTPEP
jgi:hypothetical protein